MRRITHGGYLSIDQVRDMLAVGGERPSRKRVYAWVRRGVKRFGATLACVQLPGRIAFRREDVEAFLERMAARRCGEADERNEIDEEADAAVPAAKYPPLRGRGLHSGAHPGGGRRADAWLQDAATGGAPAE